MCSRFECSWNILRLLFSSVLPSRFPFPSQTVPGKCNKLAKHSQEGNIPVRLDKNWATMMQPNFCDERKEALTQTNSVGFSMEPFAPSPVWGVESCRIIVTSCDSLELDQPLVFSAEQEPKNGKSKNPLISLISSQNPSLTKAKKKSRNAKNFAGS